MFDFGMEDLDKEQVDKVVWDWGSWVKAELDCGLVVFLRSDDDTMVTFKVSGDEVPGVHLTFVESLEEAKALQDEFKLKVMKEQGGKQ